MQLLPIKITRGHRWGVGGYKSIHTHGAIAYAEARNSEISNSPYHVFDTSKVKFQVWLADWLYFLPTLPENCWRWVLGRLWHDRLAFQYERGYAAGLREATNDEWIAAFKSLTPDEREAMLAEPNYEEMKWGKQ